MTTNPSGGASRSTHAGSTSSRARGSSYEGVKVLLAHVAEGTLVPIPTSGKEFATTTSVAGITAFQNRIREVRSELQAEYLDGKAGARGQMIVRNS